MCLRYGDFIVTSCFLYSMFVAHICLFFLFLPLNRIKTIMYIRFVCVYYVGIFFLFLSDEKECFRSSSLYIYIYNIPLFSILGREAIFDISKCVICACAVRTNFKTKDFFLFLHSIDKFTYLFFF